MRSARDSYDTDSCEMRNIRSRSWNNALTQYDVMIVCRKLQGIGVSLSTNVGLDKSWDCLRKHYFNAGECRVEFRTQHTGRAARTSIRRPHGSSTAAQYVGRGGDYNLYRPKDAGGARPCRICQHHPLRPQDYLGILCLSRPSFYFAPPENLFAFNLSRNRCLVSVTNPHLRLQTSTGWRSRYLRVCFGAASATSRSPSVSVLAMLLEVCDNDHWSDRFSKNHH